MTLARTLTMALAMAAGMLPATAGPQGDKLQRSGAAPVRHGVEIDAGRVGPGPRGLAPRAWHPGGEIRGARAYPFAHAVMTGAVYDGFAVPEPHLLIEGVAFTGPVDIYAPTPVVMRGVTVRTRTAAPWAVHTRPGSGRLLFLWSEAGGEPAASKPEDALPAPQRALYLRGDGAVIYRSHLSRAADGIQIHGTGTRVIETLVDALTHVAGDHNDGIQMLGRGADAEIVRSRIVNAHPQTSSLHLIGDRVTVEDSYLAGGGWTIYGGAQGNGKGGPATRQVVVTGNLFGREHFPRSGSFGPVTYWDASPGTGNVWERNRFTDGLAVTPAPVAPARPAPRLHNHSAGAER